MPKKLPKLKPLQPVWVRWIDAVEDPGASGPSHTESDPGLMESWDHGWYVRHDRKEFVIARSYYPADGTYQGELKIPRGWVEEVVPHACPFDEPAK